MVLVRVGTAERNVPTLFSSDLLDSQSSPHDEFAWESTECPEPLGFFGSFEKPEMRDRERRPGGQAAAEWASTLRHI